MSSDHHFHLFQRISFNFSDLFDIKSSLSCDKDYVAIYDGTNVTSVFLVKHCGDTPPTQDLVTTGKTARVVFVSDSDNVGTGLRLGYIALGRGELLCFDISLLKERLWVLSCW
jgi:hypothetical protein